jgi:hypothetical protein
MDLYAKGLENCVHLRGCTWTREGSLTSDILKSLGRCPELSDVTINGQYSWQYEPMDLVQILRLGKISLIMPSISVLDILPRWLQVTGQSLTNLALICKARLSLCIPWNVLFIHRPGRHTRHRQPLGVHITMSFTARTSPSGWVPKSDERGRLVNDKEQRQKRKGTEPRKPVSCIRKFSNNHLQSSRRG